MENEIIFTERQQFRQWWLWLILLGVNFLCLFNIYNRQIPPGKSGLFIAIILTLLLVIFFYILRLETIIKKDGIYVRFFPFHLEFRHYSWYELSKTYVRKYSPLLEYGGWGIRIGIFGKGKAYNVSGNQGLQLEFNNERRLLIGTSNPEELKTALVQSGHYKE
ncbi:hypothetical protein [Flavihumibacter solisilvae]|uniref:Bacterial Pleckstrin homology domain-containing protein n=1 Tax=Flavihumibacter solisilvae TaxID=1349421 RepID=A0A0C1L417_9BACT|nr:hypothetical protein [Flavihumibacter solisilvae]KIC94356.1 hypothetical protein OI18_12095 [Flavihumibacter solisilvae]